MAKRDVGDDLADFEKNLHRQNYNSAQQLLKRQCRQSPHRAFVAASLLSALNQPPKSDSATENTEPWPKTYGVIGKLPKKIKQSVLMKRVPRIKDAYIALWKISDKQIIDRLFEYEFCVTDLATWPQGACHKKGIIDEVLMKWATRTQDEQGNNRLSTITAARFEASASFDWQEHGVWALGPDSHEEKTTVIHRPSGLSARIPDSLSVTSAWSFAENWSDSSAALVDPDGYRSRAIASFFERSQLHTSMEEWVDFASRTAEQTVEAAEAPNRVVQDALRIVMQHGQQPGASSATALLPSSPTGPP